MQQTRHNGSLQLHNECGKIDITERRKVEIFSQMIRHTTALILLIAELCLGFKPNL